MRPKTNVFGIAEHLTACCQCRLQDMLIPRIPLERMGRPEDVAGAIFYLCSPDSGYVTGTELWVTGGQHLY